jgi:hypothetical protein
VDSRDNDHRLFLKKDKDGRLTIVSGQMDPILIAMVLLDHR